MCVRGGLERVCEGCWLSGVCVCVGGGGSSLLTITALPSPPPVQASQADALATASESLLTLQLPCPPPLMQASQADARATASESALRQIFQLVISRPPGDLEPQALVASLNRRFEQLGGSLEVQQDRVKELQVGGGRTGGWLVRLGGRADLVVSPTGGVGANCHNCHNFPFVPTAVASAP